MGSSSNSCFQTSVGLAVLYPDGTAEVGQLLMQLRDVAVNELHAGVFFVGEVVQNLGIENEDRQYRHAAYEGVVKAGIVVQAEIAAVPEDGNHTHVKIKIDGVKQMRVR
jgi:hypothetical protein